MWEGSAKPTDQPEEEQETPEEAGTTTGEANPPG